MNRESVTCKRIVPGVDGFVLRDTSPGDFIWGFDSAKLGGQKTDPMHHIYIHLPGESRLCAIRVQRGSPGGHRVWGWNGNEDSPTLEPSIDSVGVWHGFLRAGRLESV